MPDMTPATAALPWYPHAAPFGHCAACDGDLPVQTGGDGTMIVSLGHCLDCNLTTVWEVVNAN